MTSHRRLSPLTWGALALVIIGAVNWGLVGLFKLDVVAALLGSWSPLSRFVYVLVALAGVYLAIDAARLREDARATPGRPATLAR